jgi:hypothetical protein
MAEDYAGCVERLRADDPDLAREVAGFRGIAEVLAWMERAPRDRADIDLVGQDEFAHDFLVRLVPTRRWLAFGVT